MRLEEGAAGESWEGGNKTTVVIWQDLIKLEKHTLNPSGGNSHTCSERQEQARGHRIRGSYSVRAAQSTLSIQ